MLRLYAVAIFAAVAVFVVACAAPPGPPGPVGGPDSAGGGPPGPAVDEALLEGPNNLMAFVAKRGAKIRVLRNVSYWDANDNGTWPNATNATDVDGWGGWAHGYKWTRPLTVFLDRLEEVDADLNALKPARKLSSFASVDFDVTVQRNVDLPFTAAGNANVTADCLRCNATLDVQSGNKAGTGAHISLSVCAITAGGFLDLNGEVSWVKAGQLKITLTVANWPWKAPTNKLAVDITLKGRSAKKQPKEGRRPSKFSLGASAAETFVDFSSMVNVDNAWFTMPADYPKLSSLGVNNVFTLVFDHFNDTAIYDPNVEPGSSELSDDWPTDDPTGTTTTQSNNPSSGSRYLASFGFTAFLIIASLLGFCV